MASDIDKQHASTEAQNQAREEVTALQQTKEQDAGGLVIGPTARALRLLYSGRLGVVQEAPRAISADAIAIGRAPPAPGICLPDDDRVSRVHAIVRKSAASDELCILDNGSRNGIFVNGARASETVLHDGDVIRVGNSFFVFRASPAAADAERLAMPSDPASAGLLGSSPAIWDLRRTIEQIGPSDASVLLFGESGTGKELTAEALHRLSPRARGPFIGVNCAVIPENLAESLLFGHEKGAFTGADRPHEGYFRAAHNGTLFLDEVAELPQVVQPKLLRALERRQVTPVGAIKPLAVDVRIIAATNRDLIQDINEDKFRGDLFFRLADLTVHLPPLRDRKEDILLLLLSAWPKNPPRLAAELVDALLLHHWPYNVRELLKVAKELQIKGQGRAELGADLVSERLAVQERLRSQSSAPELRSSSLPLPPGGSQIPTSDELILLLRKHNGNISAIAREKEKSRMQVNRWLAARGLDKRGG